MSGVSWRGEFADCRAIGSRVAIMPSVSVVIHAKNQARGLEHAFGTIWGWVDDIILVGGHSTDDPTRSRGIRIPPARSSTSVAEAGPDSIIRWNQNAIAGLQSMCS
jgi:hypothetical protein